MSELGFYLSVNDAISLWQKMEDRWKESPDKEVKQLLIFVRDNFPSTVIPITVEHMWEVYDKLG